VPFIIVYYARKQQNHTHKTQNYTTVHTSKNDKNTIKTSYHGTDHNRWSKAAAYRRQPNHTNETHKIYTTLHTSKKTCICWKLWV